MKNQVKTANSQEAAIAKYSIARSTDTVSAAILMGKSIDLVNRLRNGIVHGYFQKKDGTTREFFGTTNTALASRKTISPIGTEPRLLHGQIPFIDCETGSWRSMRIGSFIGYGD